MSIPISQSIPHPAYRLGIHMFVLYVHVSTSAFQISSSIPFFSSVGKESACSAGDLGSIPGLGRCPGEGNGNPAIQYSCLENPMDRGAWRATVHGVAKSQTD